MSQIRSAVILAAGMSTRLRDVFVGQPKGFLPIGKQPLIERSLDLLFDHGLERVVLVTGYLSVYYEALQSKYPRIQIVYNPKYAESGSMYSLWCARDWVDTPFLLLESDLIYERRALQTLLATPLENGILTSDFTNSGDEIYVAAKNSSQQLAGLSKRAALLTHIVGELVGISKISQPLWQAMVAYAEAYFVRHDLCLDYEEGALHHLANSMEIFLCKVEGLLWAEIDDATHLRRVQEEVWPQIKAKESIG